MSFILTKGARLDTLNQIVNLVLKGNATLHLLGSSIIVGDLTTLAALHANEATWAGYSPQLLGSWTPAAEPGSPPSAASAFCAFVPTGPGVSVDVWGYYLTDNLAAKLYGVESYASSGPISIEVGQPYVPLVTYDLDSLF